MTPFTIDPSILIHTFHVLEEYREEISDKATRNSAKGDEYFAKFSRLIMAMSALKTVLEKHAKEVLDNSVGTDEPQ